MMYRGNAPKRKAVMITLTLTPEQFALVRGAFHWAGMHYVTNGNLDPVDNEALYQIDQFADYLTHPSIMSVK